MPCVQLKPPIRDDGIRYPNISFLYNHYDLATLDQINSDLFKASFNRLKNSTLEHQLKIQLYPKIKLDFHTILYKRQLVEDLKKLRIDFDLYRSFKSLAISQILNHQYEVPSTRHIYIHESDFVDYQSDFLNYVSEYLYEDWPFLYQVYDPRPWAGAFESFTANFKQELDLAMVEGNELDTRFDNIFKRKSRV